MFTFIEPIHLAISTHQHHNNIHNNIDNNNNNTVFPAQKSVFVLPTPTEVVLHATILYPTLQAIYTVQKALLSNNFL